MLDSTAVHLVEVLQMATTNNSLDHNSTVLHSSMAHHSNTAHHNNTVEAMNNRQQVPQARVGYSESSWAKERPRVDTVDNKLIHSRDMDTRNSSMLSPAASQVVWAWVGVSLWVREEVCLGACSSARPWMVVMEAATEVDTAVMTVEEMEEDGAAMTGEEATSVVETEAVATRFSSSSVHKWCWKGDES